MGNTLMLSGKQNPQMLTIMTLKVFNLINSFLIISFLTGIVPTGSFWPLFMD